MVPDKTLHSGGGCFDFAPVLKYERPTLIRRNTAWS